MFEHDSRYARLPTATRVGGDGRTIAYAVRRVLPPSPEDIIAEVEIGAGDRLDLVAVRTHGDPGQWWQIMDANPVLDPWELEREPGARVRIAAPRI